MIDADVLLIYPPHDKVDFVTAIPHLASYVKKNGFKVDALDAPSLGFDYYDIADYVGKTRPRSVGISIPFTVMAETGLELIRLLKWQFPNLPLIVGGVHPTLCPDEFKDYAFVCVGDGERVLVQFLDGLKKGDYGVRGLMAGLLESSVPVETITTPDWSVVQSDKYFMRMATGEPAFPIQGSRGCVYNCVFCSSRLLFKEGVKWKTIEQIDEEIQAGIKQFGVLHIVFRDENITLNLKKFFERCDYLRGSKIKWWAQTRANLIDADLANYAKASGCVGLSIGVETGDPYVMKMIQKGITLEQVEEAFKVLKGAGLKTAANFMIGHPWDTKESIQNTRDFADKIDPDYYGIQIATPFPGTVFREVCFKQGIELKENWGNYKTHKGDNYTPPGLKGYDLVKIRNMMERDFYYRKPSRFLIILRGKQGLRSKLREIRRIVWGRRN